jgi:hypothetical protein
MSETTVLLNMFEGGKLGMLDHNQLDTLCINTIRTLAMDGVQKANSGHPGPPMGMAPMAYALWTRFLKHNPTNPQWADRDRFILSAGHASMLIYSLLHLTGYDLSLDDLKNFVNGIVKLQDIRSMESLRGWKLLRGPSVRDFNGSRDGDCGAVSGTVFQSSRPYDRGSFLPMSLLVTAI